MQLPKNNEDCVQLLKQMFDSVIQHEIEHHQTSDHEWKDCLSDVIKIKENSTFFRVIAQANSLEKKRIALKVIEKEYNAYPIEILEMILIFHTVFQARQKLAREIYEMTKAELGVQ